MMITTIIVIITSILKTTTTTSDKNTMMIIKFSSPNSSAHFDHSLSHTRHQHIPYLTPVISIFLISHPSSASLRVIVAATASVQADCDQKSIF
jgi:hypothetical protein